jgi:hypothetical protein
MPITVVVEKEKAIPGRPEKPEAGFVAYRFETLEEARALFPSLDPDRQTAEFTKGMGEKGNLRFESWAANNFFST